MRERPAVLLRGSRYLLTSTGLSLLLIAGCTGGGAEPSTVQPTAAEPAAIEPAAAEFTSDDGAVTVHQVRQMSVVIETPEGVVYADPTGGAERYADHPEPDVILVSHEHDEHYDAATLDELVGPDTQLVVPPYVMELLPERLRANAVPLANGERSELGEIEVEAIPAYGLAGEARTWHPEGRGNGYVVTADDRRLYVAGSTEATPEMLALEDIYLALLPLYPPYATGPEDAVRAVSAFGPEFTYVYQYNSEATRDEFVQRMADSSTDTTVIAPDIAP